MKQWNGLQICTQIVNLKKKKLLKITLFTQIPVQVLDC